MIIRRWYRKRRQAVLAGAVLISLTIYVLLVYVILPRPCQLTKVEDVVNLRRDIQNTLEEVLKAEKGTGCEIPKLDPFSIEATQFDKFLPKVECSGTDWVKCFLSECRVVKEILDTTKNIQCTYRDVLFETDNGNTLGAPTLVLGDNNYTLLKSDHVNVECTGQPKDSYRESGWSGHAIGFRTVKPERPPFGREGSLNVLILGFDSTSRNGFIRRMPKSYKVLKEELEATVLKGYNIVGDGTPAALLPILTGRTEMELPESRKSIKNSVYTDEMPFIFYKLKPDGYRTAFFEDSPDIGTFTYRFNGFRRPPTDHYLRPFTLAENNMHTLWFWKTRQLYCVGDTPQYKLMFNITDQFFHLDGKKFCFTFIVDITHDDFNMISTADEDLVSFLRGFKAQGRLKDTMLMVMGDHGPRYAEVRDTLQGKLEERLPLMAIVLPEDLKLDRPNAQEALESNADVLTTAHDIHATVLDTMGLTRYWNEYKVKGADLPRGMTLLEPVPQNRSCSEAGVEPHWCACSRWLDVPQQDPLYQRTAKTLVDHINSLTDFVRSKCALRTLTSIKWMMKQRHNQRMLSFVHAEDVDGYVPKFDDKFETNIDTYQVKIILGPGKGVYEASMTYNVKEDKFHINTRDISRINAYGTEPSCISDKFPHLYMFCYCND